MNSGFLFLTVKTMFIILQMHVTWKKIQWCWEKITVVHLLLSYILPSGKHLERPLFSKPQISFPSIDASFAQKNHFKTELANKKAEVIENAEHWKLKFETKLLTMTK